MNDEIDPRPKHCRNRLKEEGEAYPKSGCPVEGCGGSCIHESCARFDKKILAQLGQHYTHCTIDGCKYGDEFCPVQYLSTRTPAQPEEFDTVFPQLKWAGELGLSHGGLTKREVFAGLAMQSIANYFYDSHFDIDHSHCVRDAVSLADALIEALDKTKPEKDTNDEH